MQRLPILLLGLAATPSLALAAPKTCSDPLRDWEAQAAKVIEANKKAKTPMPLPPLAFDPNSVDCLKDGVLVVNGDTMATQYDPDDPMAPAAPLVTCSPAKEDMTVQSCVLDYRRAMKRVLDLVGAGPDNRWDQVVIFGQAMSPAKDAPAPLFYREGFAALDDGRPDPSRPGVNEVDHIGIPTGPRVAGHPFIGYIRAGGTDQAAHFVDVGGDGPLKTFKKEDPTGPVAFAYTSCQENKNPRDPDDLAAQDNPALCYSGFYNFFDALAQATGSMFGPYLIGPNDRDPSMAPLVLPPGSKDRLVALNTSNWTGHPQTPENFRLLPRIWNSLLDTGGSLFAGNTYRDNGDGTYETTKPSAYYGINVPFEAGWAPGTTLAGRSMLRFQPLDLYAMGLLPTNELPATVRSFMTQTGAQVTKPLLPSPAFVPDAVGPSMGLRRGIAFRPIRRLKKTIEEEMVLPLDQVLLANGGERSPPFATAPHVLKQLWVVVTKPQAWIEKDAKDDTDKLVKQTNALQHLDAVANWRHQFAAYYYMLTGYRGRLATTFEGADDNAYWEFGQPTDDKIAFVPADGVRVEFRGAERPNNNTPDIQTVMRIGGSPGGQAGIAYNGKAVPLRIVGDPNASRVPPNAVTVRMRVPQGLFGKKASFASIVFDNGPTVRVPATPANLVPDGHWHTYSAALASDDFQKGTFTGFTFVPSSEAFDAGDDAIEVEFIRMNNVPSNRDSDIGCDGKAKPDGWVDSADNCPDVYNPLQEDGNGDGIGDACEDFDGDGVPNACDNCPTVTNSRQRDQNGNGVGDVCDSTQSSSCFLNPSSLAGPIGRGPGGALALALAALAGAFVYRRRRR